jgi:hypothetical protein
MRSRLIFISSVLLCVAALAGCAGEGDNEGDNTADTVAADTAGAADTTTTEDATAADTSSAADTATAEDATAADSAETSPPPPDIDYTSDIDLNTYAGPTVAVSGHAMQFSQGGGRLEGAEVTILEFPSLSVTTDVDGAFRFPALPVGAQVSLILSYPNYPAIQTGTITLGAEDVERVTFQAPDKYMYGLMARMSQIQPRPDLCQIATTVTRRGLSMYDSGTSHGEPDATVSISPTPAEATGPIYFNLVNHNTIYPDLELTHTSLDGGALYLNVDPGEYTLRAEKPDTTFTEVVLRCRPGMLVNASPPWGLQATEGGLGPVIIP